MLKYFITITLFLFLNSNLAHGLENKILLKIDKEIITTVDIANEIGYLQALNKDIYKLDQDIIIAVSYTHLTLPTIFRV